jgi:hypothetical protein
MQTGFDQCRVARCGISGFTGSIHGCQVQARSDGLVGSENPPLLPPADPPICQGTQTLGIDLDLQAQSDSRFAWCI